MISIDVVGLASPLHGGAIGCGQALRAVLLGGGVVAIDELIASPSRDGATTFGWPSRGRHGAPRAALATGSV